MRRSIDLISSTLIRPGQLSDEFIFVKQSLDQKLKKNTVSFRSGDERDRINKNGSGSGSQGSRNGSLFVGK